MAELAGTGESGTERQDAKPLFAAAGSVLGAIAASSCCLVPLALFSLGMGGAWIGNLAAMAPYQPIFIAITVGFLGAGSWLVRRQSKMACTNGAACARPTSLRIVKFTLVGATLLVAAAAAFPFVAPWLLDI